MLIFVNNGVPIFDDLVGRAACPFVKQRALKGSLDNAVAGALRMVHPRCNDLDGCDAIAAWQALMLGFHPSLRAINKFLLRGTSSGGMFQTLTWTCKTTGISRKPAIRSIRIRADRGAGKVERGLELLKKAAKS